jgi:hypothetical protein
VIGAFSAFADYVPIYPMLTIVIVSSYNLFLILGESLGALASRSVVVAVPGTGSTFSRSFQRWLFEVVLFGHEALDLVRRHVIPKPGVPHCWPMLGQTNDMTASGDLVWPLSTTRIASQAPERSG